MKKILVLMSTYNGDKYLKEQLDSILSQEEVEVHCLIRDDGSNDYTQKVIQEYCLKNSRIKLVKGNNIGWAKSFYELVEMSRFSQFDYYAFADQDDVWETKKLKIAIEKLDSLKANRPLLYCSNLKIVDENLNWVSEKYMFDKVYIGKERSLVENFSVGCTQVFNNKMKELFLQYKPQHLHAHDYWMYLIATFIGEVIYDNNAYIRYRQHNTNVHGAGNGYWELWKRRIKLLSKNYLKNKWNQHSLEKMAQELLHGYSRYLDKKSIETIEIVGLYRENLLRKLFFFFSYRVRKSSLYENIELRIRILLGIV